MQDQNDTLRDSQDPYNVDPNNSKPVKTSSTDGKSNSKTTGDSQVQDGEGVVDNDEKSYEKSDEQQEYIEQANNNTAAGNVDPVQNDKGMTMLTTVSGEAMDDDDDDDSDDDDPPTEIEVGDDPNETKKKIPVM